MLLVFGQDAFKEQRPLRVEVEVRDSSELSERLGGVFVKSDAFPKPWDHGHGVKPHRRCEAARREQEDEGGEYEKGDRKRVHASFF